jgi:1-acyl-sn-glycerol-3-phosphate acyltransferase
LAAFLTAMWLATAALRPFYKAGPARLGLSQRMTARSARGVVRIMGIRARATGSPPPAGSFIAPNHLGYLDVFALASIVPAFFLPKSEVAGWPIVGRLIRATDHPFVERGRNRSLAEAVEILAGRLRDGLSVCVFLEGTSTGGDRVLPFHAGLLEGAIRAEAPVVPAALKWSAADPAIDIAEDVAYWKDHVFGPHLWRVLGLRGLSCEIVWGTPIASAGADRKALAVAARRACLKLGGMTSDGEE